MTSSWSCALGRVADCFSGSGLDWMLVGSAATAVHGAAIEPGDIDIAMPSQAAVCAGAEALRIHASPGPDPDTRSRFGSSTLWFSSATEPVLRFGDATAWTFARWLIAGTKVELAHIDDPESTDLLVETAGQVVWDERQILDWNGTPIPVVPLEVQLATMVTRDQTNRLHAALAAVDHRNLNLARLRHALADRQPTGHPIHIPQLLQPILADE